MSTPRRIVRPLVAAITLHPSGGGVSVVSQLLWNVVSSHWRERARLVTLFDHASRPATLTEKIRFAASLAREQTRHDADWILFSHLALLQAYDAIPRKFQKPYGVFLHGVEAWQPLTSRQKRRLARAEVRLANSEYTAERVMKIHPDIGSVDPCPLTLLPASTADDMAPTSFAGDIGAHAVLLVGRMSSGERYKGHDQLIDAWPLVLAAVPDARLIIVGEGDDRSRLMAKAQSSAARERIAFTGFVNRSTLDSLYERAALFALPSRGEGFGLVYLEAMSHRLACIGSVHDAAREVIVDGETGCLVNQDDLPQLAATIVRLLADDETRSAMGEAGRQRLAEAFSLDRFTRQLRSSLEGRAFTRALA